MKNRITIFLLYLLYWYTLFLLARIFFLLLYSGKSGLLSLTELSGTFIYGFKLDMGIAAYISFLPSLALAGGSFLKNSFTKYFYHSYTLIAIIACTTIISGDLFMYRHWGFRLDATPLFYMTNLKAMTASVSLFELIGGIISVFLLSAVLFFAYLKLFSRKLDSIKINYKASLVILPLTISLFILMRGGIGIASLTTSTAYFSKNQFANHAAINPVWNVGFSLTESNDLNRKYIFYNETEVAKHVVPLFENGGTSAELLNTNRPNIVLIITESLTAKALEATGGRPDIMPELNNLVKEGVLFSQVYASSDRTDKGIAAVLAGYPSLPGSSPLKYQKLTETLDFIPKKLNSYGYRSEFYYGGTLNFANYRSFLVQAGFDKLVSDKDFTTSELISKWGAFDHVVFNRMLDETPDNDNNFFKTILTLTSHEPFIIPVPPVFKGEDEEIKFLNSLHYTDQCIGDFFRKAKKMKWWENTLFIIIADHGSRMPGNSDSYNKEKYHIPMLWLGGALRIKDTIIDRIASQTDLAATLLSQLRINSNDFKFSKNILKSPYYPYSFFTFSNGFGFLKPDKLLIYNTITNEFSNELTEEDSISTQEGKSYLQSQYNDFYTKNKSD